LITARCVGEVTLPFEHGRGGGCDQSLTNEADRGSVPLPLTAPRKLITFARTSPFRVCDTGTDFSDSHCARSEPQDSFPLRPDRADQPKSRPTHHPVCRPELIPIFLSRFGSRDRSNGHPRIGRPHGGRPRGGSAAWGRPGWKLQRHNENLQTQTLLSWRGRIHLCETTTRDHRGKGAQRLHNNDGLSARCSRHAGRRLPHCG